MTADLGVLFQDKNALIGLLLAAIAGIAVRYIDKLLRSRTDYFTEAQKIREEQRTQINSLTKENESLYKEVDEWRSKYWEEVKVNAELNAQVLLNEKLNQLLPSDSTPRLPLGDGEAE